MKITETFVRGFICIFHTNAIGNNPNAQSVTADIAAWAYVTFAKVLFPKQTPVLPPTEYWIQR
jgi:hypothetical protein